MHRLWVVLLALLVLAGCSSRPPAPAGTAPSAAALPTAATVKSALYAQHADWRGTPYRLGGTGRSGVDCSGFVQTTFQSHFGVQLPRTTEQQARIGSRVARGELVAGDLVFFRTGGSKRHVGIYVEGGKFLHASTSQGVTLSRLDNPYWQRHYWQARRPH